VARIKRRGRRGAVGARAEAGIASSGGGVWELGVRCRRVGGVCGCWLGWASWLAGLVGPRRVGSGATRAGCVGVVSWAEGKRAGRTGWAEARREERLAGPASVLGCLAFLFFISPFLIPYPFIPLLYLLPKAPKLVYMCYQHVQLLVGPLGVIYGLVGPMSRVSNSRASIYKEGRLAL